MKEKIGNVRVTMYCLVKYIVTLGEKYICLFLQRSLKTDLWKQANLSIQVGVLKLLKIYGT